jgi:DNA-binding NarL/FixJ family response regulator
MLAATGQSSREIADKLVVSTRTVDSHLQHIYQKTGVTCRKDLRAALGGQVACGSPQPAARGTG